MHHLRSITIDALTEEVLLRLRTNRAQHAQIVEEAWAGFAIKAAHALKERLKEIEKGRRIGTTFRLQEPVDHTTSYDSAISALELHLRSGAKTVELDGAAVATFIDNRWEWRRHFLVANSIYSDTARKLEAADNGRDDDQVF